MISVRFLPNTRAVLLCLLPFILAACDQNDGTPADKDGSATPEAKTWSDIPVARPEDRVTIHYHRQGNDYDEAGLWTWDASVQKQTPASNELTAIGRNSFGVVFQLDRAKYGGSERIGLIPRLAHSWNNKDGGDKIWTPALGNEVWLVSGKDEVASQVPDISPHIEAAYVDGPKEIVLNLSNNIALPAKVTLKDRHDAPIALQGTYPAGATGHPAAIVAKSEFKLVVVPKEPLDLTNGRYQVQVEGFGSPVGLTPRAILEDKNLYFDALVRLGAEYTAQGTTFRLFAPTATGVNIAVYNTPTGSEGRSVYALQPRGKGLWETSVTGDLQGKFYAYLLDGPNLAATHEALDPYATNAVAGSTRGLIAAVTPPPRPGPAVASPTDMVIYEMHVRDFTQAPSSGAKQRGLYPGFAETGTHLADDPGARTVLDHLTELGVTHVQLLPVQDYENNEANPGYNWGYVTTAFFSPEGSYASNPNDDSRVREFKGLVDALHARGIGVILDVVYNHTSFEAPFNTTVPGWYPGRAPHIHMKVGLTLSCTAS